MQIKPPLLGSLLILAALLGACRSGEVFMSPPLTASVVDAQTGAPVERAIVTMWSTADTSVRVGGRSDGDGRINLPRLVGRKAIMFPFVADPRPSATIVRFEKAGYVPKEINDEADMVYFTGQKFVELTPYLRQTGNFPDFNSPSPAPAVPPDVQPARQGRDRGRPPAVLGYRASADDRRSRARCPSPPPGPFA